MKKPRKQQTLEEFGVGHDFPDDVKAAIIKAQNGRCAFPGCVRAIDDFHHRFPKKDHFKRLYPLFIHSPFNCVGLCRHCHDNNKAVFAIQESLVREYEAWLQGLASGPGA